MIVKRFLFFNLEHKTPVVKVENGYKKQGRGVLGLVLLAVFGVFFGGTAWGQTITDVAGLNAMTPTGNYVIGADFDASGYTASIDNFSGTLEADVKTDGTFYTISGLNKPLFNSINGGTVKNVMLKNVHISQAGNVGAIACSTTGATRIYNCGILPTDPLHISDNPSTVASSDNHNCGSLVGLLDGTARIINCFSYAWINKGGGGNDYYVGGLVGNNNQSSNQDALKTIVVNCMFYGDIDTIRCSNFAPVYGNNAIENNATKGINPYCFFSEKDGTFSKKFLGTGNDINSYKRSWPAAEEYLTRFEYYRSILNSNRQLMAWWVSGNVADTALISKWVLDPSIAPYPILKKWGKYPSIINPDPDRVWDTARGDWVQRIVASPYQGKKLGTLSVTVRSGSHAASGVPASKDIELTITDMDTLNYDYCYYKVQLPYYNEEFGNRNSTGHDTRYGGNYKDYVVTGWKITKVNGLAYNSQGVTTTFVENWESGYNFADRTDKFRDLYGISHRVYAQGGYYYVPEGVTSIEIEAYWGKAVYLRNTGNYIDRVNITPKTANRSVGDPFSPAGTLPSTFQGQAVWDAWHTAVTKLDEATLSNNQLNISVYDQAIVLLGNLQWKNVNGAVGTNIDNKWHPYTIMSIDQDLDNEPDYCFEFQFRDSWYRPGIQPIRFDFLPVPELGMAVRHGKQQNTIGIFVPQGHFEITETSYMHTTQFEYDAKNGGGGNPDCGPKIPAPIILNGGHFEQIVVRYGPQNTTQYFLMGGHFRMLRFTPGAHTHRATSAKMRLCAVNAIGGEYPEFYLSGIYRPDIDPASIEEQGNPHCYTNGGRFGIMAGAGYDKILGSVTFKIDHSIIREFYGGGINGAKPVDGNIDVTIDHSLVLEKYCGGPKVGSMINEKTVTTHATGTTFKYYYGGGNGGTSYYRNQGYDGNDYEIPLPPNADSVHWADFGNQYGHTDYGKFNPLNTRGFTPAYESDKGYHALYEFECFVESNGLGQKPTIRTYIHWAQFGTTRTGNVTNVLDSCIIEKNFYGGGNLGNVDGWVESTISNSTIMGNVFGGGYSSKIEPFRIHDKSKTTFPSYDGSGVMHNGSLPYLQNSDHTDRYYTWCYRKSDTEFFPKGVTIPANVDTDHPTFQDEDGNWHVLTMESLEGLGAVANNVTLTLEGSTTVGTPGVSGTGNVYGGGDESAVNGSTLVKILDRTRVFGNIYGGGNMGTVTGDTKVIINGEVPESSGTSTPGTND